MSTKYKASIDKMKEMNQEELNFLVDHNLAAVDNALYQMRMNMEEIDGYLVDTERNCEDIMTDPDPAMCARQQIELLVHVGNTLEGANRCLLNAKAMFRKGGLQ